MRRWSTPASVFSPDIEYTDGVTGGVVAKTVFPAGGSVGPTPVPTLGVRTGECCCSRCLPRSPPIPSVVLSTPLSAPPPTPREGGGGEGAPVGLVSTAAMGAATSHSRPHGVTRGRGERRERRVGAEADSSSSSSFSFPTFPRGECLASRPVLPVPEVVVLVVVVVVVVVPRLVVLAIDGMACSSAAEGDAYDTNEAGKDTAEESTGSTVPKAVMVSPTPTAGGGGGPVGGAAVSERSANGGRRSGSMASRGVSKSTFRGA